MTREELREKVAGTFAKSEYSVPFDAMGTITRSRLLRSADAAITIVLEEAAKVAEGIKATIYDDDLIEVGRLQACKEVAAAIRALGEKP